MCFTGEKNAINQRKGDTADSYCQATATHGRIKLSDVAE